MAFLGEDYLLGTASAKTIFRALKDLPIVDAHNHADVKTLAKNCADADPWRVFAGTDHYVWSLMRRCGVPENLITGSDTSSREKFRALAQVMPRMVGNPVFEWIHLDLRRYCKVELWLNAENADAIFDAASQALASEPLRPLSYLRTIRMQTMCSTDDPCDTLEAHDAVNALWGGDSVLVRPTWRPDKAMQIAAPGYQTYLEQLGKRWGGGISDWADFKAVLRRSHDFFAAHGCRASDHGVEIFPGAGGDEAMADLTLKKVLRQEPLAADEILNFQKVFFAFTGTLDMEKEWVCQLHFGPLRNVRASLFRALGADSGGDCGQIFQNHAPGLIEFLNFFDGRLKTVLYCFDPHHISTVASIVRCFGDKVKIGAPWWQCDSPIGMRRQLEYFGSVDLLANCAGMVSDSRKLLSYGTRHEMFRRVLSSVLGELCERGQAPLEMVEPLAIEMAYEGPRRFFQL